MERDVEGELEDRVMSDPAGARARAGGRPSKVSPDGSAPAGIRCPECGGAELHLLHGDDVRQFIECASPQCLHDWSVPASEVPANLKEKKEADPMADLKCPECGRKFVHKKRMETHAAKCTANVLTTSELKARKVKKPAPCELAVATSADVTVKSSGGSVKDRVLAGLRATIADLEGKLVEARELVKGIEKIEVAR